SEKIEHDLKIGKVQVEQKEMKIAVKTGFIHLLEIQLPGKRKMKTQDLLNGFDIGENAFVA
ncbi:MAG: methionyl-tRNA formyltransferase, partial [Pricia sp.]